MEFSQLYETVSDSSITIDAKLILLTKFKGHIKKELVTIKLIPNYFSALLFVLHHYNANSETSLTNSETKKKIILLTHSALCYLIKRVAMQSPTNFEHKTVIELLFYLINLIPNEKRFWGGSIRALEAIYLVSPIILEDSLQKICLNDFPQQLIELSNNGNDLNKTILTIEELVRINEKNNRNPMEILQNFSSIFVKILNELDNELSNDNLITTELIKDFLKKYYNDNLYREFVNKLTNNFIRSIFTSSKLSNKNNIEHTTNNEGSNNNDKKDNVKNSIFDVELEINQILKNKAMLGTQTTNIINESDFKNYNSSDQLVNDLVNYLTPFQEIKETEQNWKLRQLNIKKLREILSGNFPSNSPIEFISICKDLQFIECISKAALSLRTTLSLAACLLIRDFCEILNHNLDLSIIEQIFIVLKTLLSTTKKIASQSALYCLVSLLVNVNFHNKLFQSCFMLINEKTVSPRISSSVLLRIFLIKFQTNDINNNKLDSLNLYIEEWLKKGISDAQTSVRESMRLTFWYYYKCYPTNAKKMLNSSFSPQLKKSIELSMPSNLQLGYTSISTVSSIDSSRRSSLVDNIPGRRFPSYAQPTSASQRSTTTRSTSEFTLREKDQNNILSHEQHKGVVGLTEEIHKFEHSISRKVSAPPSFNKSINNENQNTSLMESQLDINDANSTQIDLTGEITGGHSNTLLKKYMEISKKDARNNSQDNPKSRQNLSNDKIELQTPLDELETFYLLFNNIHTSREARHALQIMQNKLLIYEPIDFDKINQPLRKVMIKHPIEFKSLLSIFKFYHSIPLNYTIDLYAINSIETHDIIGKFNGDELVETISNLMNTLVSNSTDEIENIPESSLYYMKYRHTIFNFCLRVLNEIFQNSENNNIDNEITKNSIQKLTEICGRDFDESLYYETLYIIYLQKRDIFVSVLKNLTLVSTKLKIFHEIEHKDQNFRIEEILSNEISKKSAGITTDNENEDRKYMEMTMVNPFNQKRSTSGSSVVHSEPRKFQDNTNDHQINSDFTTTKYSDMTKIVSIYQGLPDIHDEVDADGDIKIDDKSDGPNVGLSDIFQITEKEHTVKFSTEPPRIINNNSRSISATDSDVNLYVQEEHSSHNASGIRDKSPRTSLPEFQSKELSLNFDNFNIKSEPSSIKSETSPVDQISNFLKEAAMAGVPSQNVRILSRISPESLTHYYLSNMFITEDDIFTLKFQEMQRAVRKIKSGSFAMKHLNRVLETILSFHQENELVNWLTNKDDDANENGYNDILNMCNMLLQSANEAVLLPVNIVCKSLLLVDCLLLLNNNVNEEVPLKSSQFSALWISIMTSIGKLSEYSNEIYILLEELKEILISIQFFSTKDVTAMLSSLATGNLESSSNIKEVYLLDILASVLDADYLRLKNNQYSEIMQTMVFFVNSDITEWRVASSIVSVNMLKLLKTKNVDPNEINKIYDGFDKETFHFINMLASR